MKTTIALFLLITLTSFAQNGENNLDGKFALQFQIGPSFTLRAFQGITFSGKHHFTQDLVVRLGIGFDYDNSEGDGDDARQNDNFIPYYYSSRSSAHEIDVNLQVIYYLVMSDDIAFYLGGGPVITNRESKSEQDYADTTRIDNISNLKRNEAGLGFTGGVEWFVKNNISLNAEYGFEFLFGKENSSYESSYGKSSADIKYTRILSSQVKFGVSLYF